MNLLRGLLVGTVVAALLAATPCSATGGALCSCVVQSSAKERIEAATEIFTARIIAVRDTGVRMVPQSRFESPAQSARIVVQRRWKGGVPDTLTVWTFVEEGMCGTTLKVGQEWLFLFKTNDRRVVATAASCSNALLGRQAQPVLQMLGEPLHLSGA